MVMLFRECEAVDLLLLSGMYLTSHTPLHGVKTFRRSVLQDLHAAIDDPTSLVEGTGRPLRSHCTNGLRV